MNRLKWLTGITGLLAWSITVTAYAIRHQEPALSPAEQMIVESKIATLKRAPERNIAKNWSNAKKIAEFFCRPAAIPFLKEYAPEVDRVFLGTDDPNTLTLKSNQLLVGSGEFRTPQGWQDFTFTCELDPKTGKVISFQPVLSPVR